MGRIAIVALLLVTAFQVTASPLTVYQQRAAYKQALDHLTAGRTTAFNQLRADLADYALAPYLDYYDVQTRLSTVSDEHMQRFQERHGGLPVAGILHYRWLKRLGARRDWPRLLTHYRPTSDAELRCYHLRALVAAGRRDEAMAGVAELWTVGRSQPKACDPVFDAWIDAGQLTEGQVWERLQLALAANQRQLGRYLLRFFEGPLAGPAKALYDVHVNPSQLENSSAFRQEDDSYVRTVIAHGLRRLAVEEAEAAAAAWQRFQDSHEFSADQSRELSEAVTLASARNGQFPDRPPSGDFGDGFAASMAEAALAHQNWSELSSWIDRMPGEQRNELRWQYWLARALSRTHIHSERARLAYEALADERHYYGFLAAEQLGRQPAMNGASAMPDAASVEALESHPDVQRAMELYAVGDHINARREWFALLGALAPDQQYAAALLAQQVGWVAQSISIANAADLRNHLDVRFPVAYRGVFQRTAHVTTVPQTFLLAVARQESAFDPRARSSANALGLMQLLQPTASHVARRVGVAEPSATDLYDPAVNVELGGHHLASLLQRYGNRRPLAAAAYNAGEGRVDRWIRGRDKMPMDVWIETIPFGETRNYVKNVLAFNQVYGQMLGAAVPMLDVHETSIN